MVQVRKGYGDPNTKLAELFKVVKLATKEAVLKTIGYTTESGAMEIAAIADGIPYLERRDETKPGRPGRAWRILRRTGVPDQALRRVPAVDVRAGPTESGHGAEAAGVRYNGLLSGLGATPGASYRQDEVDVGDATAPYWKAKLGWILQQIGKFLQQSAPSYSSEDGAVKPQDITAGQIRKVAEVLNKAADAVEKGDDFNLF
ncbi:hypothetical protein HPB52_008301 [Rhipicephalus sanguineus]|uniref:Uncharacterized protein n=1 Tax=Rhipicephalus sanguineus TaxID=34632 RepID=A0A9D4PYR4_RHISA|nr:hypothetical protein HPB52_008301 [Rhipicephalus sanguineus]